MHLLTNLNSKPAPLASRLKSLVDDKTMARIWQKDATLWPGEEVANRLDWLDLPQVTNDKLAELTSFANEVRDAGFKRVVLLGMGGSSLAPEVFMQLFGAKEGYPTLEVLDSTHPEAILALQQRINLAETLFLVSSKSGSTVETLSLFHHFFAELKKKKEDAGSHFVALTDPGSKLEQLGKERGVRRVFATPKNVGGRFSALSTFGLLPAALIGVDLTKLIERAKAMATKSGAQATLDENPSALLGAFLGEFAKRGRDKLTLVASPSVAHFAVWVEQLIAESTGKDGRGILPVVEEELGAPTSYADDRLFLYLQLAGDNDTAVEEGLAALDAAGHPVFSVAMRDLYDLGGEILRFELATAIAGAILEVNPFDQPDVEAAKRHAREHIANRQQQVKSPASSASSVEGSLQEFINQLKAPKYFCVMAYLPQNDRRCREVLAGICRTVQKRFGVATTLNYGPRFLHSTGQLHKGDGGNGVFLQVTDQPDEDLAIPGQTYTFAELIQAQAAGDFTALEAAGRSVLRVDLGKDKKGALQKLRDTIEEICHAD